MDNLSTNKAFLSGDAIIIADKNHPWYGERGILESYGAYGLPCLNLKGWLINLTGHRTYAKEFQLSKDNKNGN